MYDYAHTLSDAIEGTTHSLCTLEFEDHRPLYDWFLDQLWQGRPSRPRQIEFSRANLMFTVTSKRKLKQLVDDKHVDGWDDPRMPTLAGIRRRGYTPRVDRRVRAPHRHDEEGKGGRARPARGLRARAFERDARRAVSPCSTR